MNSIASSSSPLDDQSQSSEQEKIAEDEQQHISEESELEQNDLDQSQSDCDRCSDINLNKDDPTYPLIETDDTLSSAIDDSAMDGK